MDHVTALVTDWKLFVFGLVVFGVAPRAVLRLLVRAYPPGDLRRQELIAEFHAVPRWEQPFWVAQQLETALVEGLPGRLRLRRRADKTHVAVDPVRCSFCRMTFDASDKEQGGVTTGILEVRSRPSPEATAGRLHDPDFSWMAPICTRCHFRLYHDAGGTPRIE